MTDEDAYHYTIDEETNIVSEPVFSIYFLYVPIGNTSTAVSLVSVVRFGLGV